MKLLSIIFSFRNEEKNIPELINRITSAISKLNNWKYEKNAKLQISSLPAFLR